MHRFLIALMAIGSLLMTNPTTLRAQDDGQAVDPARGPHAIDEPVSPAHGEGVSGPSRTAGQIPVLNPAQTPPPVQGEVVSTRIPAVHIVAKAAVSHRVRKQHSWF